MTDAAQLSKWFERETVTGVQAAFMLAGAIPVKNLRPNMKGTVGDWYGHILDAVKAERLATVGPVERRTDVSAEYIDSLTMGELERFESEWRALDHPAELDTSHGTYRFWVEPATLGAWAKASGWELSPASKPDDCDAGWWYVIPLRWAFASGKLDRNASPTRVLQLIEKAMEDKGFERGRRVNPRAQSQQRAVKAALHDVDVNLAKKLPTKPETKRTAAQLLAFAAELNRFEPVTDEEALFNALESSGIAPPTADQLARLTTEIK